MNGRHRGKAYFQYFGRMRFPFLTKKPKNIAPTSIVGITEPIIRPNSLSFMLTTITTETTVVPSDTITLDSTVILYS